MGNIPPQKATDSLSENLNCNHVLPPYHLTNIPVLGRSYKYVKTPISPGKSSLPQATGPLCFLKRPSRAMDPDLVLSRPHGPAPDYPRSS